MARKNAETAPRVEDRAIGGVMWNPNKNARKGT
jgi:hypothetical protein